MCNQSVETVSSGYMYFPVCVCVCVCVCVRVCACVHACVRVQAHMHVQAHAEGVYVLQCICLLVQFVSIIHVSYTCM